MTINKALWNKYTISWYLVDVGTSFTGVIGMLYFSQWIVIDHGIKEVWYTAPTIIATVVLLLTSTHVGWIGDKFGIHFRNFKWIVFGTITSLLLVILSGYFLGVSGPWFALFFLCFYSYFYQLNLVPYSSFIKSLVGEKLYGKLSGFGLASGQLGSVVGVLIVIPVLAMGGFSGSPRLDAFAIMLLLFTLCVIPALILLKDKNPKPQPQLLHQSFKQSLKNGYNEAKKFPGVLPLLLSFYLFSDAIMTAILYFGIFLEKVLHVNDTTKSYMYLMVTLGFSIGALLAGWLSDKYNRKKVLIFCLIPNAVCIFTVAFVTNVNLAYLLYLILGATIGSVFVASKSYLTSLISVEKQGTIFGLYTFSEKAASIIGPLIWLFVISQIPGALGYRVALFVLGLCTLCAIIPLLYKKKVDTFNQ
ncbi:MAG: MFS transporter [Patescibacteria group bacterium]